MRGLYVGASLLVFTWKMRVAFVIENVAYQLKVCCLLSQSAGYTRLNEKMNNIIIINYKCDCVCVCVALVGKSCSHFRFGFDSINLHFIYVTFSRVAPTRALEDY